MDASFFPKVEVLGRKRKEHGHSLLFDSAMNDKVLRKNAYEERLLVKRTEHIEKEKQQTLEEHNFSKSQFLLRFLPVMKRQNELRRELLSKVFDSEDSLVVKTTVERTRPLSSYPKVSSRADTANGKVKPSLRRTVSAELRFPALQESMDDILNGYRTQKPQPKSVSPTKMRFRGNWDLGSHTNGTPVRNEKSSPKNSTPKTKTAPKGIDFGALKDGNIKNTKNLTTKVTFDYPEISKGKVTENFTDVTFENSTNHQSRGTKKIVSCIRDELQFHPNLSDEEFSYQNPSDYLTTAGKISNDDSDVVSEETSATFWKQLKFCQQTNALPENLLKDLVHTLRSDTAASKTARFLARMLNGDGHGNYPCVDENSRNLVSFQLGSSSGVHLLSDVKKRQRQEAQRLRIMRTIVLAYDTVWNERVKKISSAA